MRMRTQLLLSAITTAVLAGILGIWLLSAVTARSENEFLAGELKIGEQTVRRQLELRRAARGVAYQALARQPLMKAALAARDHAQLTALAQSCHQAGADAVAIVDVASTPLATGGALAESLASAASGNEPSDSASLTAVEGTLMDVFRIPIGADPPLGYLIAANVQPPRPT